MSDLGTLALGTYTNVSSTAIQGSDPVLEVIASTDDTDYVYDATNSSHTGTANFALADMPSAFKSMRDVAVRLRYAWQSGTQTNTWNTLTARIFKSDGTTALTDLATIASSITTTTPTNSSVITFTGVDTAATKADWDGALVQVGFVITKNKGGDTVRKCVFAAEITGTYNDAKTATDSCGVTASDSISALTITLGASDTAAVQLDENILEHRPSTADSCTVQLDDRMTDWPHTVVHIGLDDVASVAVLIAATDSAAVVAAEGTPAVDTGGEAPQAIPATDSLTIGATDEIAAISAAISASDSNAVTADESVLATVTASASDAVIVQADETLTNAATVSASESAAVQVDEQAALTNALAAADSAAVSVLDTASIVAVVTSADSCATPLDEALTTTVSLVADDAAGVIASESLRADVTQTLSESAAAVVDDQLTLAQRVIAVDETIGIALTEAAAALIVLAVTDSAAVPCTETASVELALLYAFDTTDSAALGASDAVTVSISVLADDAAALQSVDAVTLNTTASIADVEAVQAVDDAHVLVSIAVADDLALAATETASADYSTLATVSTSESVAVQASESLPTIIPTVSASETLTIAASETATVPAVTLGADDAAPVNAAEAGLTASVTASATDTAGTSGTDSAVIFYALTVADSATLGATDLVTFAGEVILLATKSVTDACAITADELSHMPVLPAEVVAMLLLESVTVEKTDIVDYWGGGARVEPAHYLEPTCSRMTRLPPDQDRASTW